MIAIGLAAYQVYQEQQWTAARKRGSGGAAGAGAGDEEASDRGSVASRGDQRGPHFRSSIMVVPTSAATSDGEAVSSADVTRSLVRPCHDLSYIVCENFYYSL